MKIGPKAIAYSITMKIRPKAIAYGIRMKIRPQSIAYSIRMKIGPKAIVYKKVYKSVSRDVFGHTNSIGSLLTGKSTVWGQK